MFQEYQNYQDCLIYYNITEKLNYYKLDYIQKCIVGRINTLKIGCDKLNKIQKKVMKLCNKNILNNLRWINEYPIQYQNACVFYNICEHLKVRTFETDKYNIYLDIFLNIQNIILNNDDDQQLLEVYKILVYLNDYLVRNMRKKVF